MTPEKWNKVKEIFNEAVELPNADREKFLDDKINGDGELRLEVEKLLASDEHAETLFDGKSLIAPDGFSGKEQIGNYHILKKIGEGGMGAVFLAERADLKQRVALKIIRRAAASEIILRRFRREQEILASLEHPNIARLLDVGIGADSTPFLAMEYVAGRDLSEFCREKNLSVTERLKLFRKICEAVAYAHSRLIVHRDLKPSNIIVNETGEPKLLDFGISKLLSETEADEKGTVTSFGMLTPNYASPEQFRGETVTTAADVYSLGVILYEMLTDCLPYDVSSRRLDEVAKIVCDTNPPRPSEAVGKWQMTNGKQPSKNATNYEPRTTNQDQKPKTEDRRPNTKIVNPKFLRGDLDNIILKALRKEPDRRYASVEQFSEDLRRHLEGLPVTARRDTFSYRTEKFVKRNSAAVVAAALILISLLTGIVGIGWQYVRAERERNLAEQRFNQVRELANNIVFKYYDEVDKLSGSTKVREMLVADALKYLDGLSQGSLADSGLQTELARAYIRIGKVQGRAYNANLGDTTGAIKSYEKGIALLEPLAVNSADTSLKTDLIGAYSELATAQKRQGNITDSDFNLSKALTLNEKFHAENPADVTLSVRLATNYVFLGDSLPDGKAENQNIGAYKKSIEVSDETLKREPNHVRANNLLAVAADRIVTKLLLLARKEDENENPVLAKQLRDEAEPYVRQTIDTSEKIVRLQPDEAVNDRILKTAQFNTSEYLFDVGRYDDTLRVQLVGLKDFQGFTDLDLDNQEQKLDLSQVYLALGATYSRLGDAAKSEINFKQGFKILDELIAHDASNFEYLEKRLAANYKYADELLLKGDEANARRNYERAFAQIEKTAHEKDSRFGESLRGFYLEKLGNCALSIVKKTGVSQPARQNALNNALASYEKAVEIWQTNGAQTSPGIEEKDKIESLRQKINRNRQMLAKL